MRDAFSPLMEKENLTRKRRRRPMKTAVFVFFLVAAIVAVYFAFDFYGIANFKELSLMANNAYASSATPTVPITTLVPTDYAAILAETPEPAPSQEFETQYTPSVTPQPAVHPGVRDDVFTNGEIIEDELSYHSQELSIEISIVEKGENVIYVAEVYFASMDNFKPVFANGKYKGGYQTTSAMAAQNNAIFAVNSDSFTAVDYGIIIRDGEVLRDISAADHLAVYSDGSAKTFMPVNISADEFLEDDALHVFNFGPRLMYSGQKIDAFLYSHIRSANPRTAIGIVEPYHYYFVVVDGRSSYSKGMTLEELSSFMASLGCVDAYNLDGGGSSTMVFMGNLINRPEGGTQEREIDGAILLVESGN